MNAQRNRTLYIAGILFPSLTLILLYVAFFLIYYRSTNPSLLSSEGIICECHVSLSSSKDKDEFNTASQRQRERSRIITSYRVSDSYHKFGINNRLCCYEGRTFKETLEENSEIVKNYSIGDSGPYLKKLGLGGHFFDFANPEIPVFVTAASSNHYLEVQALMHNLHTVVFPKYNALRFIFYDVGLSTKEKYMVRKYCRCEFRSFPFKEYPEHVKILQGYVFKPLIVQMVLHEFGFVFWMDASVRFSGEHLDSLFKTAIKDGFSFTMGDLGVGYRTDPGTFMFLGEDPCLFAERNEIWATFFLIYRTRFTMETIMRPWVSCALTIGCMFFRGSHSTIDCGESVALGGCHRFDQSVIGIILWRLYHNDSNRFHIPKQSCLIRKGHEEKYFEFLEKRGAV